MGNHDFGVLYEPTNFNAVAAAAAYWTRQQFDAEPDEARKLERYEFLGSLRVRIVETFDGMDFPTLAVHGSPRRPVNEYIFPQDATTAPDKLETIFERVEKFCIVGHTHVPGVFTDEPDFYPPGERQTTDTHSWISSGPSSTSDPSANQETPTRRASYAIIHPHTSSSSASSTTSNQPQTRSGRSQNSTTGSAALRGQ